MITENLNSLKIHKLTQDQYEATLAAGDLEENALYLTPFEDTIPKKVSDLLNDAEYTTMTEVNTEIETKKDVEGGIVSYELFMASQSSGGDFLSDEEFLAEVMG